MFNRLLRSQVGMRLFDHALRKLVREAREPIDVRMSVVRKAPALKLLVGLLDPEICKRIEKDFPMLSKLEYQLKQYDIISLLVKNCPTYPDEDLKLYSNAHNWAFLVDSISALHLPSTELWRIGWERKVGEGRRDIGKVRKMLFKMAHKRVMKIHNIVQRLVRIHINDEEITEEMVKKLEEVESLHHFFSKIRFFF